MFTTPTAPGSFTRVLATRFAAARWSPCDAGGARLPHGRVRVATLNLCLDPRQRDERSAALVAAIAEWDADVLALQELTEPVLDRLRAADVVRAQYDLAVGSLDAGYGVALLSRFPFHRVDELVLPGMMGRTLLVGRWSSGDSDATDLAVATVHLESTEFLRARRVEQIGLVERALAPVGTVVLVGDMNYDPRDPEEAHRDPRYLDVWPRLHPSDAGYTEDTDTNLLRLLAEGGESKHVRYDRVFVRSDDVRPVAIARIGVEPFGTPLGPAWLSDHFGLLVDLEVTRRTGRA